MKLRIKIIIIIAAVCVIAGGAFFGWLQLNERLIKPLNAAEELNAEYYSVYGDVTSIVTGYTVAEDQKYGSEITLDNIVPVTLPPTVIDGGVVTDIGELLGKYFRVDITANTLISRNMLMEFTASDDDRAFDVIVAYNPIGLQVGDLVDIHMSMPTGEDYIAISRKRVEGIYGGVLKLIMSEWDIAVYNSLIADTALFSGASIYTTRYLDGSQIAAEEFYPISTNILKIALQNPNITHNIDYAKIIERRASLENSMLIWDNPENERLKALLQQSRQLIPDKIAAGQSAWQTQQDIEAQKRLEEQLYGGASR